MPLKVGAVIIYDAAYEAYISDDRMFHTAFMSAKVLPHVPLRLEAFLKMQDLPEQDLDLR